MTSHRAVWPLLCGALLGGACSTEGPASTATFDIQVDVRPIPRGLSGAGITVLVNDREVGQLSEEGVLDVQHSGVVGEQVHIEARLPPNLTRVDGETELRQTLEVAIDDRPVPIKMAFRVDLRQVEFGVALQFPRCPNSGVEVDDRLVAKTDAEGYASFIHEGTPGTAVKLVLAGGTSTCRKRCVRQVPANTAIVVFDAACKKARKPVEPLAATADLRVSCQPSRSRVMVDEQLYPDGCTRPIKGLSYGRHELTIIPETNGWCRHSVRIDVPETTSLKLNAQRCTGDDSAEDTTVADARRRGAPSTASTRTVRRLPRRPLPRLDDEPPALDDEPPALDDEPPALDDEPPALDDEPPSPGSRTPREIVKPSDIKDKEPGDRMVRVFCKPPGLQVYVDGKRAASVCQSSVTIPVKPGIHKFELRSAPGGDVYIPEKVMYDVSTKKSNLIRLTAKKQGDCYIRMAAVPANRRDDAWAQCMRSIDKSSKSYVKAKTALATYYWPKNPRKVRETVTSLLNSNVSGIRVGSLMALLAAAEAELGRNEKALYWVKKTQLNPQTTSPDRLVLMHQAWAKAAYSLHRKSPKDLGLIVKALEASEQLRDLTDSDGEKRTLERRIKLLNDKRKQIEESSTL